LRELLRPSGRMEMGGGLRKSTHKEITPRVGDEQTRTGPAHKDRETNKCIRDLLWEGPGTLHDASGEAGSPRNARVREVAAGKIRNKGSKSFGGARGRKGKGLVKSPGSRKEPPCPFFNQKLDQRKKNEKRERMN